MKSYYYILAILFLVSCKEPPLPPVVEGDPFFITAAIVDGADQKLSAGVDGNYLFTSFSQDQQNVFQVSGSIRPLDCPTCGPQLRIVFRDLQQRPDGSLPDPNDIINVKSYTFYGSQLDTIAYETRFEVEMDNADNFIYAWDLGDGMTQSKQVFTHRYPTFPMSYTVQLQAQHTSCRSEITQTIDVPKAPCFPEIDARFTGNPTEIDFSTPSLTGLLYAWDLGDGARKAGEAITHDFQARGAYTVCVLATSNDCQASHCRNIEVGEAEGCAVNFSYETEPISQRDSLGLGEVEVYWIDANGLAYSSNFKNQPPNSFFEVLEVEPYDDNEKGESTLAYSFSLQCKLFAGNTEIELKIANGKMAIAYPK